VPEKAAQPPVRRKDHRPVAVVVQLLASWPQIAIGGGGGKCVLYEYD